MIKLNPEVIFLELFQNPRKLKRTFKYRNQVFTISKLSRMNILYHRCNSSALTSTVVVPLSMLHCWIIFL
ncbi:hypothetical protein LEP1GSC171_3369 [Leptospira santarosai str. HAI1380]|nr:hypothetical protein LEP1GSC171_3369 [Leptospira santarosai str. HAI1380]